MIYRCLQGFERVINNILSTSWIIFILYTKKIIFPHNFLLRKKSRVNIITRAREKKNRKKLLRNFADFGIFRIFAM